MKIWFEPMDVTSFSCRIRFRIQNWTKTDPRPDFDKFPKNPIIIIFGVGGSRGGAWNFDDRDRGAAVARAGAASWKPASIFHVSRKHGMHVQPVALVKFPAWNVQLFLVVPSDACQDYKLNVKHCFACCRYVKQPLFFIQFCCCPWLSLTCFSFLSLPWSSLSTR